jgi:hypothetical protein
VIAIGIPSNPRAIRIVLHNGMWSVRLRENDWAPRLHVIRAYEYVQSRNLIEGRPL